MACEKAFSPQEPVTITLTREQWQTVLYWLTYGSGYSRAKMAEWIANCADKKMAAENAALHEKTAIEAEMLYKIIETELYLATTSTETE